jgi:hypothetical protein
MATLPTDNANDMVARNGKESIHALLIRIFPVVSEFCLDRRSFVLSLMLVFIAFNITKSNYLQSHG